MKIKGITIENETIDKDEKLIYDNIDAFIKNNCKKYYELQENYKEDGNIEDMEFNHDYNEKLMKYNELPTTNLERQLNETKERNKRVVEMLLKDDIINENVNNSENDENENENINNDNPILNVKPDENNN